MIEKDCGVCSCSSTGTPAGQTAASARGMSNELRYRLMLENARVHDTDGFLLDGENAHYNTFR